MYFSQITIMLAVLLSKGPVEKDSLSLSSVIQKTEYAYATTARYLDSGKLVTTMKNATMTPTSMAYYFRTAYAVSGQYNFDFYKLGQSNSLYTINRNQKGVTRSWWGLNNKTKTHLLLDQALKDTQGVSLLTSTLIPKFLFTRSGTLGINIFKDLHDQVLLESEAVSGILCYKLKGSYKDGSATIWIGQKDFFIRKVDIHQTIKDNTSLHTEYFITPYSSASNAEFEFRPNRTIKL